MNIQNTEVASMCNNLTVNCTLSTVRELDRIVSLIKMNPGNISACLRQAAFEHKKSYKNMAKIYYDYKDRIPAFITVSTSVTSTTSNTKNSRNATLILG